MTPPVCPLLDDYLAGVLGDADRARFAAHLPDCPEGGRAARPPRTERLMNATFHPALARRAAGLFALAAVCGLLLGPARAQDDKAKQSPRPPRPANVPNQPAAEMQVIPLKNATAAEV